MENKQTFPPHVKINGNLLQIKAVSVEDSALYTCEAASFTGIARSIAELIVKGELFSAF